jgi:hypothetical protein
MSVASCTHASASRSRSCKTAATTLLIRRSNSAVSNYSRGIDVFRVLRCSSVCRISEEHPMGPSISVSLYVRRVPPRRQAICVCRPLHFNNGNQLLLLIVLLFL